eukprot:2466132-Prymnesium_polylepis.1
MSPLARAPPTRPPGRRARREWRRDEGAQHLSVPPRSSHGFARVPRRCTAAVQRSRSPDTF